MAAALLAKLKINKPPVPKQNVEINIREKAAAVIEVPTREAVAREAVAREAVAREAVAREAVAREAEAPLAEAPLPEAPLVHRPAVKIVDESKNVNFDRDTFLKSFKNPKKLVL